MCKSCSGKRKKLWLKEKKKKEEPSLSYQTQLNWHNTHSDMTMVSTLNVKK